MLQWDAKNGGGSGKVRVNVRYGGERKDPSERVGPRLHPLGMREYQQRK